MTLYLCSDYVCGFGSDCTRNYAYFMRESFAGVGVYYQPMVGVLTPTMSKAYNQWERQSAEVSCNCSSVRFRGYTRSYQTLRC